MMEFKDRIDAAKHLIPKLETYKNNPDVVVLGLARGGLVLAYEIAKALHAPLDVFVSRKIPYPGYPELAIGAVTELGNTYIDANAIAEYKIDKESLDKVIVETKHEIARRVKVYRHGKVGISLKNKIVLLVDDGVATGSTMFAAVDAAKSAGAKEVICVVPALSPTILYKLASRADKVVYLLLPAYFLGVSQVYRSFEQLTDEQVIDLLNK